MVVDTINGGEVLVETGKVNRTSTHAPEGMQDECIRQKLSGCCLDERLGQPF